MNEIRYFFFKKKDAMQWESSTPQFYKDILENMIFTYLLFWTFFFLNVIFVWYIFIVGFPEVFLLILKIKSLNLNIV